MKRLSDELQALSDALVRSHATGFTVSAVKLRELAQKARELEQQAQPLADGYDAAAHAAAYPGY